MLEIDKYDAVKTIINRDITTRLTFLNTLDARRKAKECTTLH